MNLLQKFKNWYNTPNRAPITLRNIYGVLQAWYRKTDYDTPKHIIEQVDWRYTQIPKACKDQGFCENCGCDLDKVWEDKNCICYPEMMNEAIWKEYKKAFDIK